MTIRSVVFGDSLNVMVNGMVYSYANVGPATGMPGVGGRSMPTGNSIAIAKLGPWDNVAPAQVNPNTFTTSVYFGPTPGEPGSVMAQWQGAVDNPAGGSNPGDGVGVAYYTIARTTTYGTDTTPQSFTSFDASFYDGTVYQSNTYAYSITACDFHGNCTNTSQLFPVSTGQGTVDGHRIGIRPTGNYWGGAGEQIDLLSGNLNFSLPLIAAVGRSGLKANFALVYNSQNWRVVANQLQTVPRILGADTGFGFGWQMMLGSVMPVYTGSGLVGFYLFTDSTGAQYHLTQNSGGIWSSTESVYVWYNSNQNRLYFRNGTFWAMGCISAGGEQDAGTLYPTIVEDTNGNQIIITYMPGVGVSWTNSSSRITVIEDARASGQSVGGSSVPASYSLSYTNTVPAYLSGIQNYVGTGETYTVNVNQGQALNSPPPNSASFGTVGLLASVTSPLGYSWTFSYETTGDGDLTEVQFPQGGSLGWAYGVFEYLGERELWQVENRSLVSSTTQSAPYAYSLTWPDNFNAVALHTGVALDDATAHTEKYWSFGSGGFVSELQYRTAPGVSSPLPRDEAYVWSQDPNGNSYLSSDTTTLDMGQTYQQSTATQQTQDGYGNVLTTTVSDYNNASTRSYSNTYLYQNSTNGSTYSSLHIYDRLWTTFLTSPSLELALNQYDSGTLQSTAPSLPFEWDSANYSTAFTYRGNVTQSNTPGKTINTTYDITGTVVTQNDNNGHSVNVVTSTATNYTLPDTLSPNGSATLQTNASYNPSFAPASVAAPGQTLYDPANSPNGTAAYTSYDSYGRVAYTLAPSQSWTSATGAQTNYTYGYASTG
jgi:hypothetical protein